MQIIGEEAWSSVGDHVFLRVAPTKGVIRFGVRGKLSPRFIGSALRFWNALVRWHIDLHYHLHSLSAHDVFHVSMLKKFIPNPDHVIQFSDFELSNDLTYEEQPIKIVDFKEQTLRSRVISYVKVQWSNHSEREATWELESEIKGRYPYLFFDTLGTSLED
ncbi:uncharacterized protein LOC120258648 [Dioscorea cayenensis subsp. rotundata]|uniref:Uncharacterized protein LOC120258648 n=1 Tax=Dioscorea cayennensis subsp. rotundata TaxID=55577 RepID=A0AB40B443_DIOCR|nr:uncharacterized protein LOC120258648 [Dioscorea cayenensis subsp. rotundata]